MCMKRFVLTIFVVFPSLFLWACNPLDSTDDIVKYAVTSGRLIKSISCINGEYFFTYDDQDRISTMVHTKERDVEFKYRYKNDGKIIVTNDKFSFFYDWNQDGQLASYSIYIDNELFTVFEFSYLDGCLDHCTSGSNTFHYSWSGENISSVSDIQYFSYTDIVDNFNVPIPLLTLPYYVSYLENNYPMIGKMGSKNLPSSVSTGTKSYDFVYTYNADGDIEKIELGTFIWVIEYYNGN